MAVELPTPGETPWDVELNSAIMLLDTRLIAVEQIVSEPPGAISWGGLPSGVVLNVAEVTGTYVRPTNRPDLCVLFTGVSDPAAVALDGDKWDQL